MLKCAEDQCPSVLEDKMIQNEIRVSCNEKATLDEDFTHSLIMQSVRTDVINKIRYVTHSLIMQSVCTDVINKIRYVTQYRVATCQGKVREKQNFLRVRELSDFEKMSGNFGHLTNVRELSGNFVMTIKFF